MSQLEGKKTLDLMEEALGLLRRIPFLAWAAFYLGVLPFTLVFLLYLLNMAHDPNAAGKVVGYSALLALLYVWLKLWQSAFAAEVWRLQAGERVMIWNVSSVARVVRNHLRYSGLSLIGLALSPLFVFPLPWTFAFHHNLAVLALPGVGGRGAVLKQSWRQARLWPGQNHLLVLVLVLICGFAFLNIASCLFAFPYLVKWLTGLESTFTRLGSRLIDLKMLIAAAVLTYLVVSPFVLVIYVLRCFYGISLETGADLLSELRRSKAAGVVLAAALFLASGHAAFAANPRNTSRPPLSAVAAGPAVSESSLDRSIDIVLESRKHVWQAPRNAHKAEEAGILRDFGRAVERWLNKLAEWLVRVLGWLRPEPGPSRKAASGGRLQVRQVAIALLVLCALGLAVLLLRTVSQRRSWRPGPHPPASAGSPVDLARADLSPEELPEEKWLDLAREMVQQGQPRLAVRALYLAGVVVLGKRELLTPTRFKSNRDYLRELRRRYRGAGSLVPVFEAMISMFEKVWYGRHETDRADVEEMRRLFGEL